MPAVPLQPGHKAPERSCFMGRKCRDVEFVAERSWFVGRGSRPGACYIALALRKVVVCGAKHPAFGSWFVGEMQKGEGPDPSRTGSR